MFHEMSTTPLLEGFIVNRIPAVLLLAATAMVSLTGCFGPSAPKVDSDSNQNYDGSSTIPVDSAYYTITGTVAGNAASLTRQESPASGSMYVSGGYGSGSYFGPIESGKGYVRILVENTTPQTPNAEAGSVALLKSTDTKATALLSGDKVTFKCRLQYEAVAAVSDQEKFSSDEAGTWELDYCRMVSPSVKPAAR
ncbi:MAG TPA: hypothetical protein VGO98_00070 [Candidatus Saccharimonadales bacterium]|jgi:hypothetical protein|nr:hypothetical protein [Candidatus Saccharimonadales bacterium]